MWTREDTFLAKEDSYLIVSKRGFSPYNVCDDTVDPLKSREASSESSSLVKLNMLGKQKIQ
jgi:hypothetical protein